MMSFLSGRFWQFAVVALLGTIAVAIAIGALYRKVTLENFVEMRAEQNLELARALSASVVDEIRELHDIVMTRTWAELQESPEIDQFGAKLEGVVQDLDVYIVNIFSPEGLVLYSTERERVGAKMLMNEGVGKAAAGQATSAIVRRDSFNRFDRIVEENDMIETYLPLRDESGSIMGVFEIHSDMSDFFARTDRTQRTIALGVAVTLLLLYLLVLLLFWRSDVKLFGGRRFAGRRGGVSESGRVSSEKAKFVATISHEVRTPLNAVLGMTDLLNLTSLTRKQREYIQTIQSSGDMLISLVDNLLDFAQMESGRLDLCNSDFDVMDLLERVLKIMGHSAYSKGLELINEIHHGLDLRVCADKRRLQQILVNVISNAIKFTAAGEVVLRSEAIETGDDRLNLRFEVTDTGPGIDEATRERLFAAFASGARPASDQPYGSGLGLTISRQLLDTMGGSIDVGSRPEGGAVVTIEVPVSRVSPADAGEQTAAQAGRRWRILCLHANAAAAASTCLLLTKWGMHCENFFDVEEGMHRLRVAASTGRPFECVLVDSALTPRDHLLTVRRIRNSPELAMVPVVLMTPISEPLGVGEVSALGNVRCINKPLLPFDLRYNLLRSVQGDVVPSSQPTQDAVGRYEPMSDIRILIAEDNPVSSGLLQTMLQAEGFSADVVDNGPAVLDAFADRHYDLLLLDCQMPGMDGDMVTRQIRALPGAYRGSPVIVAVTADTTERHRAQCLAAGMDDFVPKPIRLDTLRAGLRKWLGLVTEGGASNRQAALAELKTGLERRTGHSDRSFLSDYVGLFLSDTRKRLDGIRTAYTDGNVTAVRREGHALKGACLELGADRMARYCEDLSVAAQHDNLDEVGAVIGKLDQEFSRLRPVYESAQASWTRPS